MAFPIRQYVMIVLKGSIPIAFGGTEEPAAYGELVSIGGLNANVNKKLSAAVAEILETKLSVPKSRFFLKFYDTKASYSQHLDILERMCHCLFSFQFSCVFRPIKVKNTHNVCMLYTSPSLPRSCKAPSTILESRKAFTSLSNAPCIIQNATFD